MLYTPEIVGVSHDIALPSKHDLYTLGSALKDFTFFYANNLIDIDSISSNLHWPSLRDYMGGTLRNLRTHVDENLSFGIKFFKKKLLTI